MALPPEIRESRSDEREVFALINALRRQAAISGIPALDAAYWVSTANSVLTAEVNMGALASGILQHTVAAGVSTPGVVTVGAGLTYVGTTLDRAALTGDVTAAAGLNTTAFRSFAARSVLANATAGAAVPTELSSGTDGFVLRQSGATLSFGTLGASSIPALDARFWVSEANANLANEVDLGALGNGTLQHTVAAGVSTPTAFAGTTGSVPFYIANSQLSQDNANLFWDAANTRLGVGTATPANATQIHLNRSANSGTLLYVSNANAGANASANIRCGTDATNVSTDYLLFSMFGTNATAFAPLIGPHSGLLELVSSSAAPFTISNWTTGESIYIAVNNRTLLAEFASSGIINLPTANSGTVTLAFTRAGTQCLEKQGSGTFFVGTLGAQDLAFYTTNTTRMTVASGGNVSIVNLAAGGIVKATAATGVLAIATANTDYQAAIAWPAAGRVLLGTGATGGNPTSDTLLNYDTANDFFLIGTGAQQRWYNLGASGDANTELVSALWNANVFTLLSAATGTGTTRAIKIDADTAALTLTGDAGLTLTSSNFSLTTEVGGANVFITGDNSSNVLSVGEFAEITIASVGTGDGTGTVFLDDRAELNGFQTKAAGASVILDAVKLTGGVEFTSATAITTATGVNTVVVPIPTYTGNGAGPAITVAASFYVEGRPAGADGVTFTDRYAVWVDSGISRFDGDGTHVWEVPADATAGADTTIDGRIPIRVGGATKYIRYYAD